LYAAHREFGADVAKSWGRAYWVYRRLHLVGNDKLDGGGLERVLWIKPDHEVKNLILEEKIPEIPYQTQVG
jgi:hypothetical protein